MQIVSSCLYVLAKSPSWIIASRLVGGIGNVIAVALLTDVCRATTKEERTPILVGFNIAQQIGLLFGPACNLFLRKFNFTVTVGDFSLVVSKLNAPGLFMGILYVTLEVVVTVFYYDLARAKREEEEEVRRSRDSRVRKSISIRELIRMLILIFLCCVKST